MDKDTKEAIEEHRAARAKDEILWTIDKESQVYAATAEEAVKRHVERHGLAAASETFYVQNANKPDTTVLCRVTRPTGNRQVSIIG